MGDLPGAVKYAKQAITHCEKLIGIDTKNLSILRTLAESNAQLGKSHTLLAARTGRPLDHWREARDSYQKSLDIWQSMRDKGSLSGADKNKPDETANELAKCVAALGK